MKLFPKKNTDEDLHPVTKKPIKFAFECSGKKYYQLEQEADMSKKRFVFAQQFYSEMEMKVSKDILIEFCEAIKEQVNKGELGKAYKLADELQYRTTWLFDPETILRFASVIFFDLKEDITDYDMIYNKHKINAWKKKDLLTYFLKILMTDSGGFLNLSTEDSELYLTQLKEKHEKQLKYLSELKGKKELTGKNTETK